MTVKLPLFLAGSRLTDLSVAFAIAATASFGSPVQPASVPAATIALGCICIILLAVVVTLLAGRRTAESEEARDERFRFASALIDALPSLFIVLDREGRIVRFNRSCEGLTQFSEGELRGQYLWQGLALPTEMDEAKKQVGELLAGEFPCRSQSNWRLRDNSSRTIAWSHNALRDEFGRVSYIVSTGAASTSSPRNRERRPEDVTRDCNNLLIAISGYSGPAVPAFKGNRLRNQQLVNGNDLVRNVERLVRVMAGDSIPVEISLEVGLPAVYGDGGLLEECLMHLAINAKEAMPNGGTLRIRSGVCLLTRPRLDARPPIGPGEFVTLSVQDTGCGIAPEALPQLFEPFFTTKTTPHSNGMGLAMVYGIVRQAKGSIAVHSEPGIGSTFWIYLPLGPEQ